MLNFIYYIELNWLLIDSFSGYLLNNEITLGGGQSIGSIIRIMFFILFLTVILKHYSAKHIGVPLLMLFMLAIIVYHGFLSQWENGVNDYQFHVKLLLPVMFYNVIRIQRLTGLLNDIKFKKIIIVNCIIMLGNLSLSFFGFGFSNYASAQDEMIGGKGYFYSGNEVNATLTILYALVLIVFGSKLKGSPSKLIMVMFLFFLASISLASKTALLAYVLLTLFAFFNYLTLRKKLQVSALLSIVLLATSSIWLKFVLGAIDLWRWMYSRNPNLMSFLTTERSDKITDFTSLYTSAFSPLTMLFGAGWMGIKGLKSFENDFFDLLVSSGIFGLFILLVWFTWLVRSARKYLQDRKIEYLFVVYTYFIVISVSILAGHVMYSAMLSPFAAMIAAIPFFIKLPSN